MLPALGGSVDVAFCCFVGGSAAGLVVAVVIFFAVWAVVAGGWVVGVWVGGVVGGGVALVGERCGVEGGGW